MSYDLYFYSSNESDIKKEDIQLYLTTNLVEPNNEKTQWFFENKDTDVYYYFELNDPKTDPESIELFESFPSHKNTDFSFHLNFLRPDFFGLEAFMFVDKFLKDLDLFVLNPQGSNSEEPYEPGINELYDQWSKVNLEVSADNYAEANGAYMPIEKSNAAWQYNVKRQQMQQEAGNEYFVPRVFFRRAKNTNDAVTVSTWTEHIPNVFYPADYYILCREYKKLFRKVKDKIVISHQTVIEKFNDFLDNYNYPGCKIITPKNAAKVGDIFNALKTEKDPEGFIEPLDMQDFSNAK